MQVSKLRDQQSQLKAEAAYLNKQAERLSSPTSFAQSAKLTRKAVAKEKEAASLQAQEVRNNRLACCASFSQLVSCFCTSQSGSDTWVSMHFRRLSVGEGGSKQRSTPKQRSALHCCCAYGGGQLFWWSQKLCGPSAVFSAGHTPQALWDSLSCPSWPLAGVQALLLQLLLSLCNSVCC